MLFWILLFIGVFFILRGLWILFFGTLSLLWVLPDAIRQDAEDAKLLKQSRSLLEESDELLLQYERDLDKLMLKKVEAGESVDEDGIPYL